MKALTVYKIKEENLGEFSLNEGFLADFEFSECTGTQDYSIGFSKELEGTFVSDIAGYEVITVTTQKKTVKKNQIEAIFHEQEQERIEATGVGYNKEEEKECKQIIRESLLPKEFPNEAKHHTVFISKEGYVFVGASSKVADEICSLIRQAMGTFPILPLELDVDVSTLMTDYVRKGLNTEFTLGDKVSLVTQDGIKASFSNGSVYNEEPSNLVEDGAMVTSLAINYDGVLDFVMKDDLTFSGLKFDKYLFEGVESEDKVGNLTLQMGEINKMVNHLIKSTTVS